ncbi:hypothetical protein NXS19_005754 [Fusarium pseudograminearum]|nr:hypothetical protein NXS19_005754 [Fusarium pseudograminearum]
MNDNAESIHFDVSEHLRTDSTIETDPTPIVPGPSVTGARYIRPIIPVGEDTAERVGISEPDQLPSAPQLSLRAGRSLLHFTFCVPESMQNFGGGYAVTFSKRNFHDALNCV